jgi:hypothetical protein
MNSDEIMSIALLQELFFHEENIGNSLCVWSCSLKEGFTLKFLQFVDNGSYG